jgi:hypothetical protein
LQTGNQFSSFNNVQQENNNYPTQLFKQVLATGSVITAEQLANLETLLFSFPQCGILHAIYARSGNLQRVNEAAAWFGDSNTLQKVVKHPDNLRSVSQNQIIFKSSGKSSPASLPNEQTVSPVVPEPVLVTAESEPLVVEPVFEIVEEETFEPFANQALQHENINKDEDKALRPIYKEEPYDETQQLIVESIAASDYFVFDKAFADRNQPEQEAIAPEPLAQEAVPEQTIEPSAEESTVTRYHDDKMPYSFMWWLDKTRNKHSNVYRPFANSAFKEEKVQLAPEAHLKEPLEERKKEEDLVERFIQEEPQIKPPDSSKLDNENKGKQSEEDHEELITETLARIYADQMLYSKAIAAYKILMLKNPEKRRYFASQIESLQKKIN